MGCSLYARGGHGCLPNSVDSLVSVMVSATDLCSFSIGVEAHNAKFCKERPVGRMFAFMDTLKIRTRSNKVISAIDTPQLAAASLSRRVST